MSGLELVSRARETLPGVAAIVITGYASIDNVVDALRSGVDDFVTKPFSVAEIRNVVGRVLQARSGTERAESRRGADADAPAPLSAESAVPGALARRFRDLSIVESVHTLLAEDLTSMEVVPRADPTLAAALHATRSVLLAPGSRDGAFRVRSATTAAARPAEDLELGVLALVVASGVAGAVDREPLAALAPLLDGGPIAAAPLSPRDPEGDDSGVLVVSRPVDAPPFGAEDLRVLGVTAAALGDVFHSLRAAERAEEAYVASLSDVVAVTESRTPWFARHSERVHALSLRLARRLGLPASEVDTVDLAARLLDLGRIEVPDDVLGKPGRPSNEEWRALRDHASRADDLIRPFGRLRNVKPVVRHHHENWDGSGYPDGLRGDEIPFLASLVRITDAYVALTAARAWRGAMEPAAAVRQIVELSGRHFHPQLVAAFTEMHFS